MYESLIVSTNALSITVSLKLQIPHCLAFDVNVENRKLAPEIVHTIPNVLLSLSLSEPVV